MLHSSFGQSSTNSNHFLARKRSKECQAKCTIIFRMSSAIRWAFNWKEWNPSEREFEYAISCVQNDEKTRLGRFVFRKDVRASLVGKLLMRKFVNEYTDLPYDKIVFIKDEHNKPVLKAEWKEIRGSASEKSETEQISMFCRHWALKESYVKALGVGIVVDLRSIDFRTNSELSQDSVTTDTALYIDGIKQNWLFEETLLDSQHCVAVALQENDNSLRLHNNTFETMNYDKLIAHAVPLFPLDPQYMAQYFAKSEQP
ncbi:l-aminoadipate-semialdehyde dehydrogenase-phosphopantetheinyl transferase [Lasius niger]|uniref:holo-[acyl-carrier-protein] synthase n=1 Tax=Lasius niger TaxID=67767 RepID=A0A0J7KWD3_LASNI|nr:l-aminoadipate-semialdehyde dehydrogenase-phosphopantetheinyl transferase [Lasius niger]